MRGAFAFLSASVFCLLGCTSVREYQISGDVPNGWAVERHIVAGFHCITFSSPAGSELELFRWPADRTGLQATKAAGSDYPTGDFLGDHCHGRFAAVEVAADRLSVTVVLIVQGETWTGRFIGARDDWIQTLAAIKTMRRMDK